MDQGASEPLGESWKLNPDFHKMSDFLGVNVYDRNDFDLAKKMSHIHDWAKSKGGKDMNDVLWQVRGLQKELGHNFIGKPLINEMFKFVRLKQDRESNQPKVDVVRVKREAAKEKGNSIQSAVAQTVQSSIQGMVQKALGDKKLIQGTVENAIKEALK